MSDNFDSFEYMVLSTLDNCGMPKRFLNQIKANIEYLKTDKDSTEQVSEISENIDFLKNSFEDFATFEKVAKLVKTIVDKPTELQGLFIMSQVSGAGKSHLLNLAMQVLVEQLLRNRKSRISVKIIDILELKDSWVEANYNFNAKGVKEYIQSKYLFLDNFGKEAYSSEQGKEFIAKFYIRIFEYRLNNCLTTFIASSIDSKGIAPIFGESLKGVLQELCFNFVRLSNESKRTAQYL